jgi:alkanesulfonate monooxygenase SsuD/methylene tetrahydromethanopterin reductase-like flavin-dependent oxidoreductase (luciferase family)
MEEIFKITKDERRAKALKEMALDRFSKMSDFKEPYRVVEEYYEIIKELLTSFMYSQGFKTLSHKSLIEFSAKNIKSLSSQEISLIDELRIKRNNIVYYGEKVTTDFLKSREKSIKEIIKKLIDSI